jgi:diaminopimelate dehydrogenase
MHKRECFVVAEEGADKAAIEKAIKTMPDYFEPYDTTVEFITAEEMANGQWQKQLAPGLYIINGRKVSVK